LVPLCVTDLDLAIKFVSITILRSGLNNDENEAAHAIAVVVGERASESRTQLLHIVLPAQLLTWKL